MELQITWGRTFRVWWAFLWRNLIATVVAMVMAMVFGFVVGVVGTLLGLPLEAITAIAFPIGFLIGLAITIIPLRLILGKDFGEFRLVLVANQGTWTEQAPPQATSPHFPQ
jgi:hypothetical protein